MKLNIWLYNSSYTIVSSQYVIFDEVPKLIDYLEKITENNDYTYRIENKVEIILVWTMEFARKRIANIMVSGGLR